MSTFEPDLRIGHTGFVTAIAFSPSGELLASAEARQVLIWDVASRQELRRLRVRGEYANALAFSPDGSLLALDASAGAEIWDVTTGKWLGTLPRVGPPLVFVAADQLLGSDGRGFLRVNVHSGEVLGYLDFGLPPGAYAHHLALSADGSTGARSTETNSDHRYPFRVVVYDLDTGGVRLERSLPETLIWDEFTEGSHYFSRVEREIAGLEHLVLSPDGRMAAVLSYSGYWLFDARTGEILTPLSFTAHGPDLSFAPNCRTLGVRRCGEAARIASYTAPGGQLLGTFGPGSDVVQAMAHSPDSQTLGIGGTDKVVRLVHSIHGVPACDLPGMAYEAVSVAWSQSGLGLAIGYSEGSALVWNTSSWKLERVLRGAGAPIEQLWFSNDEVTIATSPYPGAAVWELDTGRLLKRGSPPGPIPPGQARPDILRLRTADGRFELHAHPNPEQDACQHQSVELLDLDTGAIVRARRGMNPYDVECLAISPDASLFAGGDYDNGVHLWSAETGEELGWCYTGPVSAVAFSPDGRFIVAGEQSNGEIQIWDRQHPEHLEEQPPNRPSDFELEGHAAPVRAFAFSPDGTQMATASADASVKVWSVGDWRLIGSLRVLPDHRNEPSEDWVSWTPDGELHHSPGASRFFYAAELPRSGAVAPPDSLR